MTVFWRLTSNGQFTCSSAFDNLRKRSFPNSYNSIIWIKEIPFKISFFMWRVLKKLISVDASTLRFQTNLGFNCSCCREAKQETINHLFIASDLAKRVWHQITSPIGLQLTSRNMENMLDQWWTLSPKNIVHRSKNR